MALGTIGEVTGEPAVGNHVAVDVADGRLVFRRDGDAGITPAPAVPAELTSV